MKRIFSALLISIAIMACQENVPDRGEFTGNEMVYPLLQGSDYNVQGTVIIKEKLDGYSLIKIQVTGTEGDIEHPVHLHVGNTGTSGAAILALLNPVLGKTGVSETEFSQLSDETFVTYQQLLHLDASIKIHLSASGPDKDIILAAGNIGSNSIGHEHPGGRVDVAVCESL
jgi:hypothetical protein